MDMIYRPSIYKFLYFLQNNETENLPKRVLDCGAGGEQPPLALFHQLGYETYGIDISDRQLKKAEKFCKKNNVELNIQKGDMRQIPFDDESFGYVYELQSMCHMIKKEIAKVIREIERVLVKGGYCFMSFMSSECWPLTGEERGAGEFWECYQGDDYVHSYYEDNEADSYFNGLEILQKEKRMILFEDNWLKMTKSEWMEMYNDDWTNYSKDEWNGLYQDRKKRYNRSLLEYIARKK